MTGARDTNKQQVTTSDDARHRRMNVESFNLDHRRVRAPYVRIADRKELPGGDTLIKYDVRFCQPNSEHLDMRAVHSIEHLSAELMRDHTDRLIDFSPMGCQTGFYALMLGVESEEVLGLAGVGCGAEGVVALTR